MSSPFPSPDTIFAEAIQIQSPHERAQYLAATCQGQDDLRREIERLVENHFRAGDFLETPPAHRPPVDFGTIERPGTRVGPYKLVEQIGEGGFGVVYLAEQERPVRRRVALKIIKPGMDTRQVIARFEAERQALAMMDHSNIAKVLDAGMVGSAFQRESESATDCADTGAASQTGPAGRPYFVMELVQGVPITKYCDQCALTTGERLDLFVSVCQAVQHAHQKGVIHRDLKPTNVLIAIEDGRPVAKIIDFGVAKAINQRLCENSLVTGFAQMIGTPLYMSPEQAELSALGVDTRTDIYSLGVILYELLTGTTPFDRQRLQTAAFDEVRRIIREEEPPRPSDRLSTLAANTANTLAESQRTETPQVRKSVRGELDWIVMKCLEKDRNRRYETASALATDVQKYLRDEPVEACPPSTAYRMRKFARRNRVALIAGGAIVATLVAATLISVWLAIRAIEAEGLAADRLHAERLAHGEAEASFQKARQAVDDMYTQVAEKWLATQPQMETVQREFLQKALAFYTEAAQQASEDPAVRFETAMAQRRMAEIQHRLGQPRPAETAFRKSVDRLQTLADEFPAEAKYRRELAAALHQFGVLLGDTGRYEEELQVHRRAIAISQKLAENLTSVSEQQARLGRAHWFVGQVLLHLKRRPEAETALRAALAIQSKLAAEFPTVHEYRHHLAQTQLRLGLALGQMGRRDEERQALGEAIAILESLSEDSPLLPAYRNELANAYYWIAHSGEQREKHLRRALTLQEKLAAEYPSVTDYRYDLSRTQKVLGDLLADGDRTEEAAELYLRAATIAEKLAADAPSVHYYRARLALAQLALGRLFEKTNQSSDARSAYERAISLFKSLVEEYPGVWQYRPYLGQAYGKLAALLTAKGHTDEAARAHREALRFRSEKSALSLDDAAEGFELEMSRPSATNQLQD